MLYPCIEIFCELVNSLLFRLAIQVSILYANFSGDISLVLNHSYWLEMEWI